ncbi:hypothetical protein [Maridesulfovibrio frigidus]|uniref:hypothetical protein n=1 Tax=Maridesulfovibrio frigidus TaxID=340956 RepID=UPI0004E1520B|nr:hypothetical protein [Maridesulfovibrio frigidus]
MLKEYYLFYKDQWFVWMMVAISVYIMGILIGRRSLFLLFFCVTISPFLLSSAHRSFMSYLKSMFTFRGLLRVTFITFSSLFIVESLFAFVFIKFYFDGITIIQDVAKSFLWVAISAIILYFIYKKKMVRKINDEGIIIGVIMLVLGLTLQYTILGYFYSSNSYFGSPISVVLDCFCMGSFIYILNSSLRLKH